MDSWISDSRSVISDKGLSRSGQILSCLGIHPNLVPVIDEWGNVDDEAGLEARRFDLVAGGGAFDTGCRVLDDQINRLRQLDADGLGAVKLHFDQRVRDQVVDVLAKRFGIDVKLLVRGRIHEMEGI